MPLATLHPCPATGRTPFPCAQFCRLAHKAYPPIVPTIAAGKPALATPSVNGMTIRLTSCAPAGVNVDVSAASGLSQLVQVVAQGGFTGGEGRAFKAWHPTCVGPALFGLVYFKPAGQA
jgi:hypothetical protein